MWRGEAVISSEGFYGGRDLGHALSSKSGVTEDMSNERINLRLAAPLALLCGSAGCTTISINEGQSLQGHYFGLVSVRVPEGQKGMTAVEAENIGVTMVDGINFGWSSNSLVVADPSSCQIMIIIKSSSQITNVREIAKGLKGEKLCLADFEASPSH